MRLRVCASERERQRHPRSGFCKLHAVLQYNILVLAFCVQCYMYSSRSPSLCVSVCVCLCVCVCVCLCLCVCVKELLIYSFAHSVSVREGTPVKELKRERRSPEGLAFLSLSSLLFIPLSLPLSLSL